MLRTVVCAVSLLSLVESASADEEAPVRVHVLAIGYNGVPSGAADSPLRTLRYADDDAAAFARLARDLGGRAIVLSAFDDDTGRRHPGLAAMVRPPTLEELRRAVDELNASFERDRATGTRPLLLLTYSGHGMAQSEGPPALSLANGALTQQVLYEQVLARLRADYVHLVVDACHAEAIVRPRDLQADSVALSADEIHTSMSRLTLLGMPTVGAMVASSSSAQAHEWDKWQQGVFSHEVLSGLRGAADVNGDLRVEYSEMAAFLSAANREVRDPSARIRPQITPPAAAPRAAIVDLRAAKTTAAYLVGSAAKLDGVWVESDDGHRIADLRSESDHLVSVLVPSGTRLFIRSAEREAQINLAPGERAELAKLALRDRDSRARGALDLSLERGLFAASFGPAYYRGFVDRAGEELSAVPLAMTSPVRDSVVSPAPASDTPNIVAWTGAGVSGVLLAASAGFGIAALDAKSDFDDANGLERASRSAEERYEQHRGLAIGSLVAGVVTAGVTVVLFLAE